ncbi:MAG: RNA polymerase-associated protein RapA [bacterium]
MIHFLPGQRWVSDTEPDLGLGTIDTVEGRFLEISFLACGETRRYARDNAPLSRVRFSSGDTVPTQEGWLLSIDEVLESGGLIMYRGKDQQGAPAEAVEMDLAHHIQFSSPEDRLFNGQLTHQRWFDLRYKSQTILGALAASEVQGLLGPRISLIPHQLYIAQEVSNRRLPRVLLSDEVGLGKTIEAGLIIHRLMTTERVSRVLILLPESLMHQWLVEMLRRFNLHFSLFNAERYEEERLNAPGHNPFLSEQLVLCSQSLFFDEPEAAGDVLQGEWDLLAVDEAHHLEWSPEEPSAEYQMVELLARVCPSVLLLTATPEQLGIASHFARLKLLDPQRFHNYEAFLEQEANYRQVAESVDVLQSDALIHREAMEVLHAHLPDPDEQALLMQARPAVDSEEGRALRKALIERLVDRHGTGRIVFRNTRANVSGFPRRCYHPVELEREVAVVDDGSPWWKHDARIEWLVQFLDQINPQKVLLICRDRRTAQDIVEALRQLRGIPASAFHEGLSIIERDRAGAWFAEQENGAQLLACSEIGSEGRNFQFSHHLVMFDLPDNPDLLEQRIGRLDRIGQSDDVQIYLPFFAGTKTAVMQRWYHEGINAFEQSTAIGRSVEAQQHALLDVLLNSGDDDELTLEEVEVEALIEEAQALAKQQRQKLEYGRDRLLELNSHHPYRAAKVISGIESVEQAIDMPAYLEQVFDCVGVDTEEHSEQALIIQPGDHMHLGNFPGLPDDGMTATFSREVAQSREDFHFLTWEHPLVAGALDIATNGDLGSAVVSTTKIKGIPSGTIMVEGVFTLQCRKVAGVNMLSYLPQNTLRCVWDYKRRDYTQHLPTEALGKHCEHVDKGIARQLLEHQRPEIHALLASMKSWANSQQTELLAQASEKLQSAMGTEKDRLTALRRVNPNVREEELTALDDELQRAMDALSEAEVKLDAVRVVFNQ